MKRRPGIPPGDPSALRRRAETQLRSRKVPAAPPRTTAQAARLLHELEVHQVELEMQNAELRTARDEVEVALERYTDLYDFAPAGYFSVDEEGRILEANLTGAAMLGTPRGRLPERDLRRFVAPASQPVFRAFLANVFALPGKQMCEVSLLREDETTLWADFQGARAASLRGERRWCRVAVSDITALKRAEEAQFRMEALAARNRELNLEIARRHEVEKALKESERRQSGLLAQSRGMQEQLRQLSRGILHAQEQERKRISRELHDEVAQSAVGINIHLEMLGREATGKSDARRKRIAETRRLLNSLVDVVHRFSRELRPTVLDDLGLNPALASFTKEFSQRTGIDVRFTPVAAAERLSATKRTVLYRVAQEALTNVFKHAHATRVEVTMKEALGVVCMDVADDGRAFAVERELSGKRHRRLGLLGMRERVEMVGGSFSIESAPGKGTRVRAQIALADGRRNGGAEDLPAAAAAGAARRVRRKRARTGSRPRRSRSRSA